MQIRAGYEISYDCAQATPMILALSVHPSRLEDLLTPDRVRLDPSIPFNTYYDSFGNFCHVIRAPAGRLTMSTDFLMHDNGEPDAIARPVSVRSLDARRRPCRDVGKAIPFDGVQPGLTPANCVIHIGTPNLRSPIMRQLCADREDNPASGKRPTDARRGPTNGIDNTTLGSRVATATGKGCCF